VSLLDSNLNVLLLLVYVCSVVELRSDVLSILGLLWRTRYLFCFLCVSLRSWLMIESFLD